MDEELEELEMDVLRQKALSTIPSKMKGYRESKKLGSDFGIDKLLASETRQSRSREHHHHHHQGHSMPEHEHRPPEPTSKRNTRSSKPRREREKKQRSRKASSSTSTSRSRSVTPSYSSYTSSGSSTSGSRSRSSSTVSHSSYSQSSSSYSRSTYSSSHSYSISPQSKRDKKGHFLHQSFHTQGSHRDSRPKNAPRAPPHHRHHHPSWYTEEHLPHNISRSPLSRPVRKGRPPPQEPRSSRNYHDDLSPPHKRRPPADYLQHRHGPLRAPPERHSHLRSSPPPPPPPALQRKDRIVRHMRIIRSPFSDSRPYSRGPPPPPPPPPHHHPPPPPRRPRRISRSPPPPPSHLHKRGTLMSDRAPHYPPSRDTRSLLGPPIRVRERAHHRSPERHSHSSRGKPLTKAPSSSVLSSSQKRSGRVAEEERREAKVPPKGRAEGSASKSRGRESAKRTTADVRQKEPAAERTSSKVNASTKSEQDKKEETPTDHQQTNVPGLSMPSASAQLLWDDGEEEELDYDESMEDLDLHPTGTIDDLEGEGVRMHRHSVASMDTKPGTVSWDDSEAEDETEHRKRRRTSPFHEELYSESDGKSKQDNKKEKGSSSYEEQEVSSVEEERHDTHIRSPIRVSPERRERRVVKRSGKSESTAESRLSAKERLYVSKNTIEEKKRLMTYHSDEPPCRLRPSLANRLGPSPRLHERVGRSSSGHGRHKGNAFAIAEEYKRRKQAELSPQEASRATMFTKRINEPDHRTSRRSFRRFEERTEENERALDKRIDSIKKKNKALEKRHKEIEKDKELHG